VTMNMRVPEVYRRAYTFSSKLTPAGVQYYVRGLGTDGIWKAEKSDHPKWVEEMIVGLLRQNVAARCWGGTVVYIFRVEILYCSKDSGRRR
jgi:hypothetical protein